MTTRSGGPKVLLGCARGSPAIREWECAEKRFEVKPWRRRRQDAPAEETRYMADPHDLLARADAEGAAEVAALEGRASPFSALYAHWERNQWSALALDLETDRRSFEALDESAQAGMVWIFAHR